MYAQKLENILLFKWTVRVVYLYVIKLEFIIYLLQNEDVP